MEVLSYSFSRPGMIDVQQATVSSLCVFLGALPVTYMLGLLAHSPPTAKAKQLLCYPLSGGVDHFIFQVLAWLAWGISILVSSPVLFLLLRGPPGGARGAHSELLLGAGCIASVFAELFMIKSLVVFDPEYRPWPARLQPKYSAKALSEADDSVGQSDDDNDVEEETEPAPTTPRWQPRWLPSRPAAAAAVVGMGLLWAAVGGVLLLATEYVESSATKVVYFILSGGCLLVAATTTHGLAGKLRYEVSHKNDSGLPPWQWRFFQPFRGGKAFVATQALGWALFSAALACLFWLCAQVVAGVAYCIRCWIFATSSLMFFAQLALALSLLVYKRKTRRKLAEEPKKPAAALPSVTLVDMWAPMLLMYTPVHLFCVAVVLSLMAFPSPQMLGLWLAAMTVYYLAFSMDQPEHTGSREWPIFRRWICRSLDLTLSAWLGGVEVVYSGKKPLEASGKYIFGYTPHGLFPIGALYLPLLKSFQEAVSGVRPISLVASVVFQAPIIRDLCCWCGVRQVARQTFVKALRERGSVLMVPGGQAELVHTWRLHNNKEFVIYTRHKGFVRMALENGAALVPVLVLGEIDTLRNLWDLPDVQQWTYKKIGFPIPYIVVGRWGLSPLPSRRPVKFVIGEPLPLPPADQILGPDGHVDPETLDRVHKAFYDAVEALYLEHAPSFPGYERMTLVMHN
eukprot:jgi/Botrbrau1/17169/Bobra.0157s0061.1